MADLALTPGICTTCVLCLLLAPLQEWKFFKIWLMEFRSAVVIAFCVLPPGQWFGTTDPAWAADLHLPFPAHWLYFHAAFHLADLIGGGGTANPAMAVSFLALNKFSYTEAVVRVAGHVLGYMAAFGACDIVGDAYGLQQLGGPHLTAGLDREGLKEAGVHEFVSTFGLVIVVLLLNLAPSDRVQNSTVFYVVKTSITGALIRALLVYCPSTGPAFNPVFATMFDRNRAGAFPDSVEFYAVFWGASTLGALAATLIYAFFAPSETFFGLFGKSSASAIKKKTENNDNNNNNNNKKQKTK